MKVTREEHRKLKYYYSIMCDPHESLHVREWARLMFDLIYEKEE